MRKGFLLLVLFFASAFVVEAQELDHTQKWNLGFGVAPNFLDGAMVSKISGTLTPIPAGLQYIALFAHLAWFPIQHFGAETYLNFGSISAYGNDNTSSPLKVIDVGSILLGPIARIMFRVTREYQMVLSLSGGLDVGSMSWDSSYTSLMPSGVTLASLQFQPGFYGRGGVMVSSKTIFFSISVLYLNLPVSLSNGNNLSATSWGVPIEVGFNF